jgi:DNA-binding transcriptional regulator of glucitol operon
MGEYAKKSDNQSRVLHGNPRASKQASADVILQQYRERSIQRYATKEDEELVQNKSESALSKEQEPVQREEKTNNTGLPDNLKTRVENLSGYSMDDVNVHYNSPKPAQLQALAYTQGADIHVAPGQEKHLPHEAWHVVQQKQGRVQPTMQMKGVNVNDDEGLEKEADEMGKEALNIKSNTSLNTSFEYKPNTNIVQRSIGFEFQMLSSKVEISNVTNGQSHDKWVPTLDGENLEIKTTILNTEDEVEQVVNEIQKLGDQVSKSNPDDIIYSRDKSIKILTNDDSAQPQVNFDLGLNSLGDNIINSIGEKTLSTLLRENMFDADGVFGWSKDKTHVQINELLSQFAKIEENINNQKILSDVFGKGPRTRFPITFCDEFRGYILAIYSQQYQATPGGLIKDIPFLIKTNLNEIKKHIVGQIAECYNEPNCIQIETGLDKLTDKYIKTIDKRSFPYGKNQIDKNNGSLHDCPTDLSSDEEEIYRGILIELRRIPITHYSKWVDFAKKSFKMVGQLFNPAHEEESCETPNFWND